MAEIYKMPFSKELEKAIALGECRFLPVLERIDRQRLDAERRRAEAEAMIRNREVQRVRAERRFDFRGRLAACTALLAAIVTMTDSMAAEPAFGGTVTALFIASGTLCFSALASANDGLRAKRAEEK